MEKREEGRHNRQSLRASDHKYEWPGTYFITIATKKREALFEIPELRAILTEVWHSLPTRFPDVTLDKFVIMPDHIYFIIHIRFNARNAISLGRVVGAYKSLVFHHWLAHVTSIDTTRQALPIQLWHRNYYDRVIRNQHELEATRQYIRDNPLKLQRPS